MGLAAAERRSARLLRRSALVATSLLRRPPCPEVPDVLASEILGLPVLLAQPIRGMQVEIQERLYLQDIPAAVVVEPGQ